RGNFTSAEKPIAQNRPVGRWSGRLPRTGSARAGVRDTRRGENSASVRRGRKEASMTARIIAATLGLACTAAAGAPERVTLKEQVKPGAASRVVIGLKAEGTRPDYQAKGKPLPFKVE